ncbi:FG-GAP repeat protein [Rutstroemia sp. NJR-2017a WRK4]|nr:FG-GAP repeat protein [Rutstroemia sp. NJR-2017a WRK4]
MKLTTILSIDKLANLVFLTTYFSSLSTAAPTAETHALEKRALPVLMGLAKSFGALGGTTLTSTGATAITGTGGVGNGGVWPGSAIVGFPTGTASGVLAPGTVLAQNGEAACLTAYNNALSLPATSALPSPNLGGITLHPGIFTFPTQAVTLSTTLTLDAAGDSTKQFIFKIGTTFTAAANAKVVLTNSAQACNVYFIVGSSASIGAAAQMKGNLIAYTAITASNAASNAGTWCALHAAVTLINNALVAQAGSCPA